MSFNYQILLFAKNAKTESFPDYSIQISDQGVPKVPIVMAYGNGELTVSSLIFTREGYMLDVTWFNCFDSLVEIFLAIKAYCFLFPKIVYIATASHLYKSNAK